MIKKTFYNKRSLFFYLTEKILINNTLIAGGRTLKKFIEYLSKNKVRVKKNIILTDERIVNKNSNFRNDKIIKNLLVKKKLINPRNFFHYDEEIKSAKYLKYFNNKIKYVEPDISILSIGAKGHIAGIFKIDKSFYIKNYYFNFFTSSFKIPKNRISCNINYINKCKKIYIIAKKNDYKNYVSFKRSMCYNIIKKKVEFLYL